MEILEGAVSKQSDVLRQPSFCGGIEDADMNTASILEKLFSGKGNPDSVNMNQVHIVRYPDDIINLLLFRAIRPCGS